MTVQCQATVTAEVLTRLARPVFRGGIDLDAVTGRVCELTIPDGAVNALVLALTDGVAFWLTTDAQIQVTLGALASNTPVSLAPGGTVALLGSLDAAVVSVTYTPGTGTQAHLVLGALGGMFAAPPPDPLPPLPITLSVTEGYEAIDVLTLVPQYDEPWEV